MNKYLEKIFLEWEETYKSSTEMKKLLYEFCNSAKDREEMDRREVIFSDAVGAENSIAFSAGFYTAVELLTRRNEK